MASRDLLALLQLQQQVIELVVLDDKTIELLRVALGRVGADRLAAVLLEPADVADQRPHLRRAQVLLRRHAALLRVARVALAALAAVARVALLARQRPARPRRPAAARHAQLALVAVDVLGLRRALPGRRRLRQRVPEVQPEPEQPGRQQRDRDLQPGLADRPRAR